MKTSTILLADDDSNDTFFFQRALEKTAPDHGLWVVRDGMETLEYLSGEGKFGDRQRFPLPCLLVLDLNMPRKNGFEVLEWLLQTPPFDTLPAVVLTSSQAEKDRQRAGELGARAYYVKPVNPSKLTQVVKAMLTECDGPWSANSDALASAVD